MPRGMSSSDYTRKAAGDEWISQNVDVKGLIGKIYTSNGYRNNGGENTPLLPISNDFFDMCHHEFQRMESFFIDRVTKLQSMCCRLENERTIYLNASIESTTNKINSISSQITAQRSRRRHNDVTGRSNYAVTFQHEIAELRASLIFLQQFQRTTVDAFRQVTAKYDQVWCCNKGKSWFSTHILKSAISDTNIVDQLIEDTDSLNGDHFSNDEKHVKKTDVRVRRQISTENRWIDVRLVICIGASVVLIIAVSTAAWFTREYHTVDWHPALQLFRGLFLIILFLILLGGNVYGWKHSGINHVHLFNLDQNNNLRAENYFDIGIVMLIIWGMMLLMYLVGKVIGVPPFCAPITVAICFGLFLFNPFPCLYYRARFWFLRVLLRIIVAPFSQVEFADFWLADQFNSLSTVFLDIEFFICYYTFEADFSGENIVPSAECDGIMFGLRPIASCLPAWFRFAQCLRFFFDTRLAFPHLVNAGKYATTFLVVLFSTLYGVYRPLNELVDPEESWQLRYDKRVQLMLYLWMISAFISAVYCSLWDILMDWRLFVRSENPNDSTNRWLRRQLLFKRPVYYYLAIVQNVILRFSWTLTVSYGERNMVSYEIVRTVVAILEIYRRFIWNYFRLEVEQLNASLDITDTYIEVLVDGETSEVHDIGDSGIGIGSDRGSGD